MPDMAKTLCDHLTPFLTRLRAQGSIVTHVDESAWSNCVLNVALDRGPSLARARQMFDLAEDVTLWFNDDAHYSIENGLACRLCRHALSWPRLAGE